MNVLGLTGGIGMGKSAAAQCLESSGIPTIDTDALAREVVEPGQAALVEIRRIFGADIVDGTGRLRREALAELVFNNPTSRRQLEEITHPLIRQLWRDRIESWQSEGHSRAAVIIPLLFETGAQADFRATICVACSSSTQRQRLSSRGWSDDQINQRLSAQWPVERKMAEADFVVWSEGGLDVVAVQLERIFSLF